MESFGVDRKKEIGERIRQIREEKGLTQAELADLTGLSLPRISVIELGKTEMRLSTFIRITEALQVSADSLLKLNTQQGRKEYTNEFAELLENCNPQELRAIIKITEEIVSVLHTKEDE